MYLDGGDAANYRDPVPGRVCVCVYVSELSPFLNAMPYIVVPSRV